MNNSTLQALGKNLIAVPTSCFSQLMSYTRNNNMPVRVPLTKYFMNCSDSVNFIHEDGLGLEP